MLCYLLLDLAKYKTNWGADQSHPHGTKHGKEHEENIK
jgi:hypothetical protein